MPVKRLLVISIFILLVTVALSHGRNIQAGPVIDPDLEPVTWHFGHVANGRLAATVSGTDDCPATAQDEVTYNFALPVTQALYDDLASALAGGGSSAVGFQTESVFMLEGNGNADYTAEFDLSIFDDSGGAETILKSWSVERLAAEPGPVTDSYTYLFTEQALDQLQVGHILRVRGMAHATVRSGGCQPTDRAAVATKQIDRSSPMLHISFTNCATLGYAGLPYLPGVNCRLVQVDEFPRAYLVHVPDSMPATASPVVFMFHGSSGNGAQYYNISGWADMGDIEGFYSVYPTGLKYCNRGEQETCKWATKWNSYQLPEEEGFDFSKRLPGYPEEGQAPWPADDVGFTEIMIDDLLTANGLSVAPDQIYASGFSSGAGLVGRLAVEMADDFAAVAYTSGGLIRVNDPENLPEEIGALIPVYVAFGTHEDGAIAESGGVPGQDVFPLEPAALLANCGLVDYFIRPHLDGLGHTYDPNTFWPYDTLENDHSTLFRWDSSQSGEPEHLFLLEVMEGVTHTYPREGQDPEKNPHGFVATKMFWHFFEDPVGYFDIAPVSPDAPADFPDCPAEDPTGDYGDAPDDTNTPGISPNTAYVDTGVSGRFPTTWPAPAPAGPVHFAPQVFLGDDYSPEASADVGPDPDGVTNIVDGPADNADNDHFDDGWLNQDALFPHCERTSLQVRIRRAALAPGGEEAPNQMYLNVWFDGNRDGDWADNYFCPNVVNHPVAAEWIVRNQPVNAAAIPAGGFVDANINTFRVPNQVEDLSHWIRFTLSEVPMPTTAGQMPDGRGPQDGYDEGETEDYEYDPPAVGLPGDVIVTQEIDPVDPVLGDVTGVFIGLEHVGGDGPAASQIRNLLPDGLTFTGPISVEVEGPGASPLLVTYDEEQDLIAWDGRIAPDSKLQISFPVRVGACYGGGSRVITNVVDAINSDGSPISAEATLTVACSPATIEDIVVERKLFLGDEEVTAGSDGYHVIMDGAHDPVTIHTRVTNNGAHPVLLGLAEVIEFKQGNDLLTGPAMEPVVDKVERFILIPIFGGESRTFTGDDLMGRLGNPGTVAIGLEPAIHSRLTYCLLDVGGLSCPDPAANPELAVEDGPINILFARRDLGDAPDSSNNFGQPMTAYPATPADFPTVRNPATGLPPGPVHITPRPFHLGQRVSLEFEADIDADQDPTNNILPPLNVANRDRADDGIQPGQLSFNHCQPVTFQAQVFISPAAVAYFANQDADGLAYLNAWLDGNGDGDWADAVNCPPEAPEHIVIDQVIDPVALGPGLQTITVASTGPVPSAGDDCAWLRIMLSDRPSEKPLTFGNVSHGDGRGASAPYVSGESEDFRICPGGPDQPDLDIQVVGRPVFPVEAGEGVIAGDALMEDMRHFELLATFTNLGSGTATGAKLDITLTEGYAFRSATLPHVDGMRLLSHCSDTSECSVDLDDIEPGERGVVFLRISGPVTMESEPAVQFAVVDPADMDPSNNQATLALDQGDLLLAPILTSMLCNNEVVEECGRFLVQGTAQPGSLVEVTLERLFPAGQISGETTAGADGLWSLPFDNVPHGEYRVYAVTKAGHQRSPRSNEWDLVVSAVPDISFVRLTDESGRQRVFNLSDDPVIKLTPGDTYQIAVPIGTADPELQCKWYVPDVGDWIILLDEDGDGIYTGEFTVPADPGAQADANTASILFHLTLSSGGAEVIRQGQVILDDAMGVVFDSDTGQPLVGASVSALELRPGAVNSRSVSSLQPWQGVPFNHPNPLSAGDDGGYRFLMPDGSYQLHASQPGYQPYLSPVIRCAAPLCGGLVSEPLGLTREIAQPAAALLTIADRGIYPAVTTIQAGQAVEWINVDLKMHNVAYETPIADEGLSSPGQWSSGQLEPGQRYKRQFNRAGVYFVFDEANPANTVTIIVENATVYLPLVVK